MKRITTQTPAEIYFNLLQHYSSSRKIFLYFSRCLLSISLMKLHDRLVIHYRCTQKMLINEFHFNSISPLSISWYYIFFFPLRLLLLLSLLPRCCVSCCHYITNTLTIFNIVAVWLYYCRLLLLLTSFVIIVTSASAFASISFSDSIYFFFFCHYIYRSYFYSNVYKFI